MKQRVFIGTLVDYDHLPCSYYGNPRYWGRFKAANGETLEGRSRTNGLGSVTWGFLNARGKKCAVTYHETRAHNVIFDKIKVLEG